MRSCQFISAILLASITACATPKEDETIVVTGSRLVRDTAYTDSLILETPSSISEHPPRLEGFLAYVPDDPDHHRVVTEALSAYLAFLPDQTRRRICRMPQDSRPAVVSLVKKKCRPSKAARRQASTETGAILFDRDLLLLPAIALSPMLDEAAFSRSVPGCRTAIELFGKTPSGWVHKERISHQFISVVQCDERW